MVEIDKIYNIDCLKLLNQLEDNSIDLILTDPPYNVGKEFENESLNNKDFFYFHSSYLFEFKRVIKNKHPIVIFFNNGSNLKDYISISGSIIDFKRLITLYKPNDCSFPTGSLLRTSEVALVYSNNGTLSYNSDKNIHDVLISNHKKKDLSFYHPSVKPIDIIKDLILAFTKEGDIVLDPFIGSGTTIVGCKALKRHFIGCDINKDFCEMACKRIYNVPFRLEEFQT